MCVCVYVYICIHTHTPYTHTHTLESRRALSKVAVPTMISSFYIKLSKDFLTLHS